MSRWPMVPLGEIAPIVRREATITQDGRYPELGIRSFGKGVFHKPPVEGHAVGTKRLFEIRPGDLLFSNVFAWEGAVAVAEEADQGRYGSHRFISCVADESKALAQYLRAFFVTPIGIEKLGQASPGGAGRNRTLGVEKLARILVPLPPLVEQQAIVMRLDALAEKSERLTAHWQAIADDANALLVTLAHGSTLSDEQKHSAGWRPCTLADCLDEVDDPVKVAVDGSYPNIGIYSYARGVFGKPSIEGASTSAKTLNRIRAGQFIYSRLFAFEGAYALVPPEFDGFHVSGEFPTFTCKQDVVRPEFLYAYFRAPQVWEQIAVGSKGLGNRRQRVQVPQLLSHKLLVPPMKHQDRIAGLLPSITELRHEQAAHREQLEQLRKAFLDQALS